MSAMAASALRKPKRGARAEGDVSLTDPAAGLAIAECLRVKGFCVIGDAAAEDVVNAAVAAIDAEAVEFYQPAVLVQEGLLGMEGSKRIARMSSGEGASSPGLKGIEEAMEKLANALGPYQDEVGFRCTTRTSCYLHEAAEPDIEEVDLTDNEANDWLASFMSRKVMLFIALGPDRGTLELVPFDEDANPTDLMLFPGMAALVRTDQLRFEFTTRGSKATYNATSFMMQGDILGMHPNKAEQHMIPAAKELDNWIQSRLREIKEKQDDEADWGELEAAAVPRSFISAANRTYFTKTQTAVRGFTARQPSCWEPEVFFLAQSTGCDVVTEVPYCRWDHTDIYDADLESWKKQPPKTSCRHAAFIEGIELFDNKMFGLSLAETKGMDPSQRQVLETTYEALFRSGMRKSTLTNSSCGMYVGMATTEWNYAERSADVGIFGATGGAPSICAGRLSFCLGCRGASLAVDTEAASGLSSIYWASESVEKKGVGFIQELACGIGVHLILSKQWWPVHSASGFLSPTGRCCSFDASADGYVRSEASGCAVVRAKPETMVDGEEVKDELPLVGTICGGATMNSGRAAGMNAPSGPTEQALLLEACKKSGIAPFDVDVVECNGAGRYVGDAVEVASCGKALRSGTTEEMLVLGSTKSAVGNAIEASGVASFGKMMFAIRWGIFVPNVHLRQLNPHLDIKDAPLVLPDENVEPRQQAIFGGVSSYGFGGTHVHMHLYGGVDEELRPPPQPMPEEFRPRLTYWPGGGGTLDSASRPRKGFFIAGTWNGWEPEPMKDESEGRHGFTVTMGENGWEQFHLLIDGSKSKILHPHFYKAPKGTEVAGPAEFDEVGRSKTWLIDCRGASAAPAADPAAGAVAEADAAAVAIPGAALGGADAGRPGDRYHICLHVAGKWRTVTWSKLQAESDEGAIVAAPLGTYYVAGDFNDWAFEPMSADPSVRGLFTFEVTLSRFGGCEFQIVRNKDWTQTVCPLVPHAGPDVAVHGPDDRFEGYNWHMDGKPGDAFKIEFQRTAVDGADDVKKVSWAKV